MAKRPFEFRNTLRTATELPVILNAGYRIERVEAVDMFPHTDHIETVMRLIRNR